MKHRPTLAPFEELSDSLRQIHYLVGKYPLHKLVPSGYYGAPGYAENGTFLSDDEGKHVSVTLGANYCFSRKIWTCRILVRDGDDMFFDYEKPFTLENWETMLKTYNDLYMFDPTLLSDDWSF